MTKYYEPRTMLFALTSNIEADLRSTVRTYLSDLSKRPTEVFGGLAYEKAVEQLRSAVAAGEDSVMDENPDLDSLLDYTNFNDPLQILNKHRQSLPDHLGSYIKEITPKLELLGEMRNRIYHARPLKWNDAAIGLKYSEELCRAAVGIWRNLCEELERLQKNNGAHLLDIEIPHYEDRIENNLPTPEFTDTGFIGREEDLKRLLKEIRRGSHPVITLVGEGGTGKTALVRHALDELLYDDSCDYEAIIWYSTKTNQFTSGEINRLGGVITDSLGLLESISSYLAPPTDDDDPFKTVLDYMGTFKIILVLDNLETVLDDRVLHFFQEMSFKSSLTQSKVLVTSRIGVQDTRLIKVEPMPSGSAIQLLRGCAWVRQLGENKFFKRGNPELEKCCSLLYNNPLCIKWFVSSMQAGERPEDLLARDGRTAFLEYCIENVYDHLSAHAHKLLEVFLALPGPRSRAELGYFSDLVGDDLKAATHMLQTSSMLLTDSSTSTSNLTTTTYDLNQLTREYLRRHQPVSDGVLDAISKKQKMLLAEDQEIAAVNKRNPYDPSVIEKRNQTDTALAVLLKKALMESRGMEGSIEKVNRKYLAALDFIEQALNLDDTFSEIHRVRAFICMHAKRLEEAKSSYEKALDLAPDSAQVLYHFGWFMGRHYNDYETCRKLLAAVLERDPESDQVKAELARYLMYDHEYDRAQELLDSARLDKPMGRRPRLKIHTLGIEVRKRRSEFLLSDDRYEEALVRLEEVIKFFDEIPEGDSDNRMKEVLGKTAWTAESILRGLHIERGESDPLTIRASGVSQWFERYDTRKRSWSYPDWGTRVKVIVTGVHKQSWGFASLAENKDLDVFFHMDDFASLQEFLKIHPGAELSMVLVDRPGQKTPKGKEIEVEYSVELGQELTGELKSIITDHGFGFITGSNGKDYFFHRSHLKTLEQWNSLEVGRWVLFTPNYSDRKTKIAAFDVELVREEPQTT